MAHARRRSYLLIDAPFDRHGHTPEPDFLREINVVKRAFAEPVRDYKM
jgi:hypothetical protein